MLPNIDIQVVHWCWFLGLLSLSVLNGKFHVIILLLWLRIPKKCFLTLGKHQHVRPKEQLFSFFSIYPQDSVKCRNDTDTYFKFLLRTMLIRLLSGLFFSGMENQVFLPMITTFCLPAGQSGQQLGRRVAYIASHASSALGSCINGCHWCMLLMGLF